MEAIQIKQVVEAALLASSQPLTLAQLETLCHDGDQVLATKNDITGAISALQEDCTERGIELVEVASGFRFQVRQNLQPFVAKLWLERPARYSRALLETLALIAYRQPITRGEIEQVRGVAVSSSIIKTLEERDWVRVVGHRDAPGRPALLGTTKTFLDDFKLRSLDQLPPLSEVLALRDPQLELPTTEVPDATTPPPGAADGDAAVPDTDTVNPTSTVTNPIESTPQEPDAGVPTAASNPGPSLQENPA